MVTNDATKACSTAPRPAARPRRDVDIIYAAVDGKKVETMFASLIGR
jgi:hypothetical protein